MAQPNDPEKDRFDAEPSYTDEYDEESDDEVPPEKLNSSMPISEIGFNQAMFGENIGPEPIVVETFWADVFGACLRGCGRKRKFRQMRQLEEGNYRFMQRKNSLEAGVHAKYQKKQTQVFEDNGFEEPYAIPMKRFKTQFEKNRGFSTMSPQKDAPN